MRIRARRQPATDIGLALAVVAVCEAQFANGGLDGPTWVGVLNGVLLGSAVLIRRRHPWAALISTFGWAVISGYLGLSQLDDVGQIVAGLTVLFALAYRVPLRPALAGFAFAEAMIAWSALRYGVFDYLWSWVILGGGFLAGVALRRRRVLIDHLQAALIQVSESSAAVERAAVQSERVRIARELHDIVAHAVSLMVVQANGAEQMLRPDPARAERSLVAVQECGRQALADLRRLLAMLRPESEDDHALNPQPGLTDIDALAVRVRDTGLEVCVQRQGPPTTLSPGAELAAYRIVQEALTNVVKHAHARSVTVAVRNQREAIEVEIIDDGRGAADGDASGGHGLVGMRERAALYGGEVLAGPRERHPGYQVWARIPAVDM